MEDKEKYITELLGEKTAEDIMKFAFIMYGYEAEKAKSEQKEDKGEQQ